MLKQATPPPKSKQPQRAPRTTGAASGYTVHRGEVRRGGAVVGTLSKRGEFRVVDERGRVHTGTLARLLTAEFKRQLRGEAAGLTGRMRVDRQTFEVRAGGAYLGGKQVGTVTATGEFELTLAGRRSTGNVHRTIGAVWLGAAKAAPRSGRIDVGGRTFPAVDGVVFEAGVEIGWLKSDGSFRAVTSQGDFLEGSLTGPSTFLKRL